MIRFQPLPWLTLATIVALSVLAGLGTWQLDRRVGKLDLIARVEARASAAAVDLPPATTWPDLDLGDWEYRRITARGTFDHDAEAYVFTVLGAPRGRFGGPGYLVVTPFHLQDGGTVLVNRGFVPETVKQRTSRTEGETTGIEELTGLIRRSEVPGLFIPQADLQAGIWYARDIDSIAATREIVSVAPFLIDAEASAPGGLPQGGETRLSFRNQHLGYAVTWYGLAVALVLVYLAFHGSQGRLTIGRQ